MNEEKTSVGNADTSLIHELTGKEFPTDATFRQFERCFTKISEYETSLTIRGVKLSAQDVAVLQKRVKFLHDAHVALLRWSQKNGASFISLPKIPAEEDSTSAPFPGLLPSESSELLFRRSVNVAVNDLKHADGYRSAPLWEAFRVFLLNLNSSLWIPSTYANVTETIKRCFREGGTFPEMRKALYKVPVVDLTGETIVVGLCSHSSFRMAQWNVHSDTVDTNGFSDLWERVLTEPAGQVERDLDSALTLSYLSHPNTTRLDPASFDYSCESLLTAGTVAENSVTRVQATKLFSLLVAYNRTFYFQQATPMLEKLFWCGKTDWTTKESSIPVIIISVQHPEELNQSSEGDKIKWAEDFVKKILSSDKDFGGLEYSIHSSVNSRNSSVPYDYYITLRISAPAVSRMLTGGTNIRMMLSDIQM